MVGAIETALLDRAERIFGLKATFNIPGDSREQECVFIQVERNNSTIKDKVETARVTGRMRIFANSEKLPFGYIAKRIAAADHADTKDFFFLEPDDNAGVFGNIVERSLGFVFLFKTQYNPERGEMQNVNLTTVVAE